MRAGTQLDEAQLKGYLLGTLSAEERADVEEKYFSDDHYFSQLRAVERTLIDDYLRNRLQASDRDDFEFALARHPAFRKSVASRAIAGAHSLRLAAVAACLVGLIAGVWSYFSQRSKLEAVKQQVVLLQRQVAQRSERSQVVLLHALAPGTLRGTEAPLRPPADVSIVRFRLYLPANAELRRYHVKLQGVGKADPIASSSELAAVEHSNGRFVDFDCPAQLLPRGDYRLVVSPLEGRGDVEYRFFSLGQ